MRICKMLIADYETLLIFGNEVMDSELTDGVEVHDYGPRRQSH